jgi:hypothetical protein
MYKNSTADMQVAMFYVFPHGQTQKIYNQLYAQSWDEENKSEI